ncbi:MAG: exo-alpha-sialidase [Alphaproteobacteria bacterium]|nr:exo-alpha-sialidase [Alphaproteobacteria bacterium]
MEHYQKIWDQGDHNAFTDLARYNDQFFCVFREGNDHISPDGVIRVLTSKDGLNWDSVACLTSPEGDLRDPKIIVTPKGQLMIIAGITLPEGSNPRYKSPIWVSKDGTNWTPETTFNEDNIWLWRPVVHHNKIFNVGYDALGDDAFGGRFPASTYTRLCESQDGINYSTILPKLCEESHPSEAALIFQPDEKAICLLRCEGEIFENQEGRLQAKPNTYNGLLGTANPPYTEWTWNKLDLRIHAPQMLQLDDGRVVTALRILERKDNIITARTALAWVDPENCTLTEFLTLPSGDDTSYAGMVWHDNFLWVSYYSSHEDKTSVYFAKISLD